MPPTSTPARRLAAVTAALLLLAGCTSTGPGSPDPSASDPGSAEQPTAGTGEPTVGTGEPTVGTGELTAGTGEPTAGTGQVTAGAGEATAGTGQTTAGVGSAAPAGGVGLVDSDALGDLSEDPAYAAFYEQELNWSDCGDGTRHECSTAVVPLDWAGPGAGEIELALRKAPAQEESIGSLLINRGGPGLSGTKLVESSLGYYVTDEIRDAYDVIGFDPRGVASSTPIECFDDATYDEYRSAEYDLTTDEGWRTGQEWMQRLSEACSTNSGPVLAHMDTASAARDMDVLRAALGEDKLDYLGFSYGTDLGATYADLHPEHAGRMVFDAALDPTLTPQERVRGQAAGFELAFTHYLEDCLASDDCPFSGTPEEAKQQMRDLMASIGESPLPTDDPDRPLTEGLAFNGVLLALYNDLSWAGLSDAIGWAMQGDGTMLLDFADQSAGRSEDGSYQGNSRAAIYGVNCLDSPTLTGRDALVAENERLEEIAPTFGQYFGFTGMVCSNWPVDAVTEPRPLSAEGVDTPPVVIGTTGDPATPVEWADALDEQLGTSRLVTWDGEGHGAYPRAGECITDLVDDYLLDGTVPEDGTVCS